MINVLTDAAERLIEQPPAPAPTPLEIRRRASRRQTRRSAMVGGLGSVALIGGLLVAATRNNPSEQPAPSASESASATALPAITDDPTTWVGRWALPTDIPAGFELRSGLQSDTERILLVVNPNNDATMSISVTDDITPPDSASTETVALGDATAWIQTTADTSGLHWTDGAASLSVTGTRSVTLDEMRQIALGLTPVDADSVTVDIEPIGPAQPVAGPDGAPAIVAGPDDPGSGNPLGDDWSKAPVVEAVRSTPLEFAIDTLGWDVGPDDVIETDEPGVFLITKPGSDHRVRFIPALTADPTFLLWVTPGRDWSSEFTAHDDVITIDLTDVPVAADAAHATVSVATTKRETTTRIDAGPDGFDHIDVDPELGPDGYFSYLIVFHDKNNEAIGALSIGPVYAPHIAQGG